MNELLNACTNRIKFASAVFPVMTSFVPKAQTSDQAALRSLLCLDRTDTDYFVVALLRNLTTYPELVDCFGEEERSYALEHHRPAPISIDAGVTLVPSNSIAPGVLRRAVEWPVVFDMTFQRLDGVSATLSMLGQDAAPLNPRVTDTRVSCDWPAWSGITGKLQLTGAWSDITSFRIHHEPVRFPFEILRERLRDSDAAHAVLARVGLLEAFLSNPNAPRACAFATCALGLSNL